MDFWQQSSFLLKWLAIVTIVSIHRSSAATIFDLNTMPVSAAVATTITTTAAATANPLINLQNSGKLFIETHNFALLANRTTAEKNTFHLYYSLLFYAANKSIGATETSKYFWDKQKYAKINLNVSTQTVSNRFDDLPIVSSESNSVAYSSPAISPIEASMTVINIENPFETHQSAIEHIYIGSSGPTRRESEAITRALDWLTDRRTSDYGWNNDTHMVILAKEVCFFIISLSFSSK